MTTPPRILVVEDEVAIQRGLCDVFAYRGYAPIGVDNGEDGLREGLAGGFDLVLLDVMLPGRSGFEVCEVLRSHDARLPILMLTARGAEEDVLRGFRCGSDDYVTKPFSVAELMARVEALLRRADRGESAAVAAPFAFGAWRVEPERLVASCGDAAIELTRREIAILSLLARERGRIVSRRRLLADVWGMGSPERIETRTVDMHVAKLRKKLGAEGPRLIETVRGEGYRLP
ncbi:MAG: response regulator transcription factor [Myxococcota bacterium]|jgi:two-component system response regulator RegX3|nr:response regulator transcription factor [Myxococcota bacterium]